MDQILLEDVGKYLYPFIGNTGFKNDRYFNILVKKYGKREVLKAMHYIKENGSPFGFFK